MILFGKTVKESNVFRITSIIAIAIIWRILLGNDFYEGPKNPYVFPVIAYCFISILLGELTRKIFRLFRKERIDNQVFNKSDTSDPLEIKRDEDTLNFSIFWAVVFLTITII